MLTHDRLREIAHLLLGVDGVEAVTLGGSRARGDHTPSSDVDLGLYYRPPLDVAALAELARELAGPDARVTEPGEWGPWVDGGAWLTIDGTPVDWLYRELDRVRDSRHDAEAGRVEWHVQVGHPLGVPGFAYAAEVALAVVLADPSGELTTLQRALQVYPPALRETVVAGLWEAESCVGNARKAVGRGDSAYVAGCLFRSVLLCAHAVHAHAGSWVTNEKGAVSRAGLLPAAPQGFAARAHAVCAGVGTTEAELAASVQAAQHLVEDTARSCRQG